MEALMKQRNEDYVRFSAASDAERQRNAPFYQGSREKKATILAARIENTPGCIQFLEQQGQNLFLNGKYTKQRLFEMLEFDLLYVHALLNTYQQTPEPTPTGYSLADL